MSGARQRMHFRQVDLGDWIIDELAVMKSFEEAFHLYAPAGTQRTAGYDAAVRTTGIAVATVLQLIMRDRRAIDLANGRKL